MIIDIILWVVFVLSFIGAFWGAYLMYLDWLWRMDAPNIHTDLSRKLVEDFTDVEYTEIARFD